MFKCLVSSILGSIWVFINLYFELMFTLLYFIILFYFSKVLLETYRVQFDDRLHLLTGGFLLHADNNDFL